MLLNVRRNFSSGQKVFKRPFLPVGDNWRFKIYLTESIALRIYFKSSVAGLKVVLKGKTFMDVFVLFCSASFRDKNFTSARIFSGCLGYYGFFGRFIVFLVGYFF